MKILGTGLNGLIGTRVVELLQNKHSFINISRSTGVDVTHNDEVRKVISESDADVVLHLAAYTNVKVAESEKKLVEQSEAWRVNVLGTENIAKACEQTGKLMVYASTDLVFDGENTPVDGYKEDDHTNPLNWYAKTKYEGELRVRAMKTPWIVIRPAYPYRAAFEKNDFVRLFIEKLQNGEALTVLKDRIITPVFIDDLAFALDTLLEKKAEGIYHTVGDSSLSIFDAAEEIARVFDFDQSLIKPTTRQEFLKGRPSEPFNSSLSNAKIKTLGVSFKTFAEGLEQIKYQTSQK